MFHDYYIRAGHYEHNSSVSIAVFTEIEIPAVEVDNDNNPVFTGINFVSRMDYIDFGRRIAGNPPPVRDVRLGNATLLLSTAFPHVSTFPNLASNSPYLCPGCPGGCTPRECPRGFYYRPPRVWGGQSEPHIGNANFHARFESEMWYEILDTPLAQRIHNFFFGSQGDVAHQAVHILHGGQGGGGGPRHTTTLPMQPKSHLGIGSYTDTTIVRHGPAVVGDFDVHFRVERPVLEAFFDNQNRPVQEVDVTLNVNDIWPDQPGPTPTPQQRDLNTKTLPYTRSIIGSDREIVVRIPRPDEYTVFYFDCECSLLIVNPCGTHYCYLDILVTPPRGYIEIPGTRRIEYDGPAYYEEFLVVEFILAFIFTKTDMGIYETPNPIINPLDGAVFHIYAWESGAWGTTPVYGPTTSGTAVTTTNGHVINVGVGQVLITHSFGPGGQYKLVETFAPMGSATPDGYWILHTCPVYHDVINITEHIGPSMEANPPFVDLSVFLGLDINETPVHIVVGPAWHVGNRPQKPDWLRLNHAINILPAAPTYIIIHPAGAPGISEGMVNATTFYLLVTDPNPNPLYAGRTITTLPIVLPAPAPGNNPHRISITRPVTIKAADGTDIILRMPIASFINTPNTAPWNLGVTPNLGRHFIVGAGGSFTLGAVGDGTLTIHGNVTTQAATRGGILIDGGTLTMQPRTVIRNCRAAVGGGVEVIGANSVFNLNGGTIGGVLPEQGNTAQHGGGV